jgi:hypothetical protein
MYIIRLFSLKTGDEYNTKKKEMIAKPTALTFEINYLDKDLACPG